MSKLNIPHISYSEYVQNQTPMPQINKPQKRKEGVKLQGEIANIFQKSFIFLILGRPGSGKTSLLSQLINRPQFYGKKFSRVLYITPSNIPGVCHDDLINTSRTLDVQWLQRQLKVCYGRCKNVLLVVDDVISQIPMSYKSALKNIFYDRRHILGPQGCLSIIVTSQRYTCIPKWLRTNANMFLSYSVQPSQIRTISTQLNTSKDIKTLSTLYKNLQKHQFLFFNLDQGRCYNTQFKRV